MSHTPSPLRYPGGKYSINKMVSSIIKINNLDKGHYAEPYAGGCGLALSLLFKGVVHDIHLNDLDRSVWAFWDSVLNKTEKFIEKMYETDVTIDEWHLQRKIQSKKRASKFDLGFSTFFLNRTNRSGIIIKAGVIGGLKQDGDYKLDCRFNKDALAEKIRRIAKYKHRIHLYNLDAIDFIELATKFLPKKSIFCIDPPYYDKGSTLYTNFYEPEDHEELSEVIINIQHPWLLTYDNVPEIEKLYKKRRQFKFNLNYTASIKRVGTEIIVFGKRMKVPQELSFVA